MRRLVVNADDLGYCEERNLGILHAFKCGVVTSASLLVNMDSSDHGLRLALEGGLPIGLHVNLTEGQALTGPSSTLCVGDGMMRGKLGLREALARGDVAMHDVLQEVEAQLIWFEASCLTHKFAERVGHSPTHIDGHQHVHVLPWLCEVIARAARAHSIARVRLPDQRGSDLSPFLAGVREQAENCTSYERHGLLATGGFIGLSTMGSAANLSSVRDALASNRGVSPPSSRAYANSLEWMVHPGYRGAGGDDFNQSVEREHELNLLCDPKVADMLRELDMKLHSWAEL